MSKITEAMIEAYRRAKDDADGWCGCYSGKTNRHYIMAGNDEIWSLVTENYNAGHAATMTELDRLRDEHALSAALSAGQTQPGEVEPVLFVSAEQLPMLPEHGYFPARSNPEGKFQTPLYLHPPVQVPVVKALEWEVFNGCDEHLSDTIVGRYEVGQVGRFIIATVRSIKGGQWEDEVFAHCTSVEKAKAAAQSDYEARILSALSTQAVDGKAETVGWRPIDTAPKDGTNVLASFWLWNDPEKGRGMEVVSWDGEAWSSDAYPIYPPTHWMPLPASPEQGETDV